jgi:hypothetical protein
VAGSCECGNETSSSIKGGGFTDQLSVYLVLKKGFNPCSHKAVNIRGK